MDNKWNSLIYQYKRYIVYKMVQASDTNHDVYDTFKTTFNTYKNILRQNIREAKALYYNKTFLLYKNNIKKNLVYY